jgi:hypothetical protein
MTNPKNRSVLFGAAVAACFALCGAAHANTSTTRTTYGSVKGEEISLRACASAPGFYCVRTAAGSGVNPWACGFEMFSPRTYYLLAPQYPPNLWTTPYSKTMSYSDGSYLSNVQYVSCSNNGTAHDARILVPDAPPQFDYVTSLQGIVETGPDGGDGIARGTVTIAKEVGPLRDNDASIAIQLRNADGAWADAFITWITTTRDLRGYEVQATVPNGTDVRLVVRVYGGPGYGDRTYVVRDVHLFTQKCFLNTDTGVGCQ